MDPYDFIHLDSMQELADWNPESSFQHAPNVSNTPLRFRPIAGTKPLDPTDIKIPQLLVCHDYKGGYHPSESSQGRCPFSETVYTAEYPQCFSTFVYFSHKRVAIPPAPWINMMHRNGVKVLGTFIIEGDDGSSEMGRILEKGSEGEFLFATQLARIAATYGFDGWLMNFESSFPIEKFSPFQLQKFLRELKSATAALVPRSEIIWYDALTILNQVHWQDGLTLLNVPFFAATNGIFTNYGWRELQLHHTALMSRVFSRPSEVYAGIDCFGRGSLGDGGFGVGTALKAISKEGLSAAVFAPGWTFENFDGKDFHSIDRKFWIGNGAFPTEPGPISEYSGIHESGTEHYFYTNFNRGFGESLWLKGERVLEMPWVHIGTQSIVPSFHPQNGDALQWVYSNKSAYTGAWSLSIFANQPQYQRNTHPEYFCPLYKLGIKVTRDLILQFTYKLPPSTGEIVGFYCSITSGWKTGEEEIRRYKYDLTECTPTEESGGWITAYTYISENEIETADRRITEVGIFYQPPTPTLHTGRTGDPSARQSIPTRVATLGELLITTLDMESVGQPSFISKVICTEAAAGKLKLSWKVYPMHGDDAVQKKRDRGLWSKLTEDFAWFVVWKGTQFVGVSHCLVFVADGAIEGTVEGEWRVDGVTWEGAVFSGP